MSKWLEEKNYREFELQYELTTYNLTYTRFCELSMDQNKIFLSLKFLRRNRKCSLPLIYKNVYLTIHLSDTKLE